MRPLAEAPQRVQAIHAGQADIEEHQVGWIAVGKRERVLCAGRSGYPVARSFKAERHAATKQDVIIDQQDVVRRHESISKSRLAFALLWDSQVILAVPDVEFTAPRSRRQVGECSDTTPALEGLLPVTSAENDMDGSRNSAGSRPCVILFSWSSCA